MTKYLAFLTQDENDEDDEVDSEDEDYVEMEGGNGPDGLYEEVPGLDFTRHNGHHVPQRDLEISISFEPASGDDLDAASVSMEVEEDQLEPGRDFHQEASRLVAAAASEQVHGEMLPPTSRSGPTHELRSNRQQQSTSFFARPVEAEEFDVDSETAGGDYDSGMELFDGRDAEDFVGHIVSRGDEEDESSSWVAVNHADDDTDDHQYQDSDERGRGHNFGVRTRHSRSPDIIESFYDRNTNQFSDLRSGAVRIAGDDLMGFLGALPMPEFLRDTLRGNDSTGNTRQFVAHMPLNSEGRENGEAAIFSIMGDDQSSHDVTHSLMRSNRAQSRLQRREGAASNPAPPRHPLVTTVNRGSTEYERARGYSLVDAILSAVGGRGGHDSSGGQSVSQDMKSIISQRRRLLGPLISERRWGTDVGDREVSQTRLNSMSESLALCVKSEGVGAFITGKFGTHFDLMPNSCFVCETDTEIATDEEVTKPPNQMKPLQVENTSSSFGSVDTSMSFDESKEEHELQECKDDVESSNSTVEHTSERERSGSLNEVRNENTDEVVETIISSENETLGASNINVNSGTQAYF